MYQEKIVYLDCHTVNPGDLPWGGLEKFTRLECYERTPVEQVVERVGDARIIITNKTRLTADLLQQMPQLKLICVSATGFDVVDVEAATLRGITVCNCAGYSTECVAQMVIAHLLNITNKVAHYTQTICHENAWSKSPDFCYWNGAILELHRMKAAIVGWGNIGKAVADRLRSFGVALHAVTSKAENELPADVKKVTLQEAFSTCDVVSLNCPLNTQNTGSINQTLLKNCKTGLILINTARGGLINEQDVAEALHRGTLGAYACDVLAHEPALPDNPLLKAPNVSITPHIAWAAPGARSKIIEILAQNIEAFLKGEPINVVNSPLKK